MASKDKRKGERTSESGGLISIFKRGDAFTKLSFLLFGMGNIGHKQIGKGLMYLAIEAVYIYYMAVSGVNNLMMLTTLGTKQQGFELNPATGIVEAVLGDNSMLILLWGVVTVVITLAVAAIWVVQIYSGESARRTMASGGAPLTIVGDVKALFNGNIHKLLLAVPVAGLLIFTVMPLIYMILMAFTNYDQQHQPPGNLFTWVGLANFKALVSAGADLSKTFWPVLGWTLIWGFIATFSCYFGGMFLAMLINSKGIRFKKMWRTIFVTTMAIPSFISLLVVRTMLGDRGIVNVLLQQLGYISAPLPFLTDATWARCTVIIVNLWVGIPVTMLMVTGILMNIPADLYESARIDGANPVVQFIKITFPYMWFVTTPYLISNLIGNFNNFGVIYFLTAGAPSSLTYYKGAGKTDLLVTWLYKLTRDSKDFNLAATIGIVIFVISATFSLISYSRSKSLQQEEGFQ